MQPRLNRTLRIGWKIVSIAGTALIISASALAGQPSGIAQVEAVHVGAQSLVLLGETYGVTTSTRIVDMTGRRATLAGLRAKPGDGLLFSGDDVDTVAWQAVQSTSGWVLTELRILEEMPD